MSSPPLTAEQLQEAGFVPCQQWPSGLQPAGRTLYVHPLPEGPAYVVCTPSSAEVQAFVGDWHRPLVYISGLVADARLLLSMLSHTARPA